MAKVKFDVTGVEAGSDFDTPIPPGLYPARLDEVTDGVSQSSGNKMLTLVLSIASGDFKGRKLWDYVVYESDASAWKLRSFLEAVGAVKDGKTTWAGDTDTLVGTMIQVRVKTEPSEEYGDRAKVGALLPLPNGAAPEDAGDAAEEGDGEDYTYADLEAMDLDDLRTVVEEEELEVRITKRSKVDTIRDKVAEELGVEPAEEEPDDDEDEEPAYEDMTLAELKQECEDRDLSVKGRKAAIIKRLEKDDEDEDDGDPF